MTKMQEQAIEIIQQIPDSSMVFVIGLLKNIVALDKSEARTPDKKLEKFKAAAGNIEIDSDAVEQYRITNMI